MRILFAASEAVPYCKTGGLADVAGALPAALGRAGHEVLLVLPLYRAVPRGALKRAKTLPLDVPFGLTTLRASAKVVKTPWGSAAFVDHPPFFEREGLYQDPGGRDHLDNDARFAFFSRALLEAARAAGFKPDVLHANDWQTALSCAVLKRLLRSDPLLGGCPSVFTIHNLAYQGLFRRESLGAAGLGPEEFVPERLEFHGRASFLKGGLVYGDLVATVSPTYAREIQESGERGFGLEGLLRRRGLDLVGILNGLDTEAWDPARDPHLARRYGPRDAAAGKAAGKRALQEELGLERDPRVPLAAVVSRLDPQKGLDLAVEAVRPLLGRLQLAALGSGDRALERSLSAFARESPGSVSFRPGFDEALAHRLYGGADLFLMPSRYEPCGLGQLIAMRYGTIPVAARTGGLADTVTEGEDGTGFLCRPGDAGDLGAALDRALKAYDAPGWAALMGRAMARDSSWGPSAEAYAALYERARRRDPLEVP